MQVLHWSYNTHNSTPQLPPVLRDYRKIATDNIDCRQLTQAVASIPPNLVNIGLIPPTWSFLSPALPPAAIKKHLGQNAVQMS